MTKLLPTTAGLIGIGILCQSTLPAQSVLKLSSNHDNTSAPSAAPFPGLTGGFRQQILIGQSKLTGVSTRSLEGLSFRRDLSYRGAQDGGEIDLVIRISASRVAPSKASELFSQNAGSPTTVFQARLTIPFSPATGTTPSPWSSTNSFDIRFTKTYLYISGHLCIDIEGRPVTGKEPDFWYVDHDLGGSGGIVTPIGTSCSAFRDASHRSLYANATMLQIGSSMQIHGRGRPGAWPLMLFGGSSIPKGIDLTPIGAIGCRQYVNYFLTLPLSYRPPQRYLPGSYAHFRTQIPAQNSLLGATIYAQFADLETALPRTSWTNPTGLTTTNGLKLQLASTAPSIEISTITSIVVDAKDPMPSSGSVDVEAAPVMRVRYK